MRRMEWIKFRKMLAGDPRVLTVAKVLGKDRLTVVGALVCLWSLADDYADADGGLGGYTPEHLDAAVGLPGFTLALPPCWCLVKDDGSVQLPDYQRHNGSTAKQRAAVQSCRSGGQRKRKAQADGNGATDTAVADSLQTRSPKNKNKNKSLNIPPLPPLLDVPAVREAWSLWVQHRAEKGQALKPTTVALQLRQLEAMGPERAAAALRHSATMGYTGIFEPKESSHGQPDAGGGVGCSSRVRTGERDEQYRRHLEKHTIRVQVEAPPRAGGGAPAAQAPPGGPDPGPAAGGDPLFGPG